MPQEKNWSVQQKPSLVWTTGRLRQQWQHDISFHISAHMISWMLNKNNDMMSNSVFSF